MYLKLDYGYLEYLQPWAARRLRREAWAENPTQQLKSSDNAGLKAEIVEVFRSLMTSATIRKDLDPEFSKSLQVTALRAIRFFGGTLSKQESAFLKENQGHQMDILSGA